MDRSFVRAVAIAALLLLGMTPAIAQIGFEAESGTLGSNLSVNSGTPTYITALIDGGGENPTNSTRVASYTLTFPAAGTYELYGRVRVGAGGANDDSFFYGNGFGVKTPNSNADWIRVNGLNTGGFTN